MQKWYEAKNYDRIEEYIKKEAYDFVNVFSIIYAEMLKIPNILKKFSSSEDEMTYMKIVTADEVHQLLQQGYSLMNESDISKTIFWNPKLKKHQYLLVKREKMGFGES